MRKRLSSKLLAVILTIAICATTVLGCLMTASAADASCYTFGTAKFAEDDLTEASIDVTFTANDKLPNGFSAGAFSVIEVNADAEDYLILKDVKPVTDGINIANEGDYYLFDGEVNTSVKFTLTFGFSKGEANDNGKEYKIKLTEVELAYGDGAYFVQDDDNGAIGTISAACKHVIGVVGEPLIQNKPNNYSVYAKSVCTLCGEEFGYQLVPTADKLGGDAAQSEGATIQWDGSSKTAPTEGSGTEADPYIISDVAHLAYITEAGPDVTHGKYYKVADGIKNIVLQKAADAETLINIDSAEEARTYIEGLSGKSNWGSSKYDAATAFAGVFDGNGATVYGLSASGSRNISLFGSIGPKAEFKNLSIKNSFVQTGWYAATLAHTVQGYTLADGTAVAKGTVKIDNCTFANNYINPQSGVNGGTSGNQCIGVILGNFNASATDSGLAVNKVMTYGNITFYEQQQANISPIFGSLYNPPGPTAETETEYCELMDCILLDIPGDILANNNSNFKGYQNVQNVYSDSTWVKTYLDSVWYNTNDANTVTKAQMLGSSAITAAPNLDWGGTWLVGKDGELPCLTAPDYVSDTIYWDGTSTKTAPTVGGGTKDNPYIISTVAELAYITGQTKENYTITDGVYYKIADGIKNIVMQPYAYGNDIMALGSAAEVKTYFEANAAKLKQWLYYGWEGSTFCGNLDFNGATVYGIYQVSTNNAGLISNVDAGAVISNLAVKNSYMVSNSSGANYQVGAIVANTNSSGNAKATSGFVWFNNCTVANNYMYGNSTSHDRSAVIIGASSDIVYVDNCLVYGNNATYGNGVTMPIVSSANNSTLVSAAPAIPDGLTVVTDGHATEPRYYNMVRNSIIFDAYPYDSAQSMTGARFNEYRCYSNVYTNLDITAFPNVKPENITTVTVSSAKGSAAQTAMPNLTWGTDWYCGAEGEYPVQASLATLGTSSVSTPSLQLVGTNVTYKEDGSLDFNIHFVPQTAGVNPTLYVGTLDGSKFMKLNAVASSQTATLGDDALMFVIPNLSARDIELVWLPTLVNEGTALVQWGKSEQLALADNARAIIAGNYAQADKNVAAALLNYGNASGTALDSTYDYDAGTVDLLEFGDYLKEMGSNSNYWDSVLADNGETGDSWENAIIIDSAEEFVYLCKAATNNVTKGKYYKVADGIAGFNLATDKLDTTKSLAANLAIITGSGKNHAGGTNAFFQGHFDGNGVTVYGAWCKGDGNYGGLFSCTKGDVTIKNVNVKLSYFKAKNAAGAIVGYHEMTKTLNVAKDETTSSGALVLPENGTLTIENCSVTDCYIETTAAGYGCGSGAIIGYEANSWADSNITYASGLVDASQIVSGYYDVDGSGGNTYYNGVFTINNCFVDLDADNLISNMDSSNQTVHGGLAAYANTNAGVFKNCIVIGVTPYATYANTTNNNHQHTALASHFSNIYTDAASGKVTIGGSVGTNDYTGKVFQLTLEQMTGDAAKANMPALDWNNVWTTTSGYPTFINKNYKAPAGGITVTWDGTVATGYESGTGTKEDPYIISTASEFAYMVKDKMVSQAATISPNKYFKVADGISAFVMQKPEYASDIIALGSAADTKKYFEANKANMLTWPIYGWEGSSFCGYFDGNGATVYGLYQVSGSNAGLFSTVDAGAVISNIALKNSYLTSSATNYQVAGIAAVGNSTGYGVLQEGVVWINGCTVANNYMYNACTSYARSGVIAGSFQNDIVMIDNCLTYGNDATYGAGVQMAVIGQGNNDVETTKLRPAELPSYVENSGFYCNTVRNSIILDCHVINEAEGASWRRNAYNCYSNVYTNGTLGETFYNGNWATEYAKVLFPITADDIKGDAATAIVDTLNAAPIGETVWYVGAAGDCPGFKAAGTMPSATQALYDGMILTNADDYGDSVTSFGVYATGLNLKVNPYMTFTFEFGYDLVKEDIQVTFKSGNTVIETVTAADMVNNEGAGRFHLYRLKTAPVIALSTGITVSVTYGGVTTDFGTYSAEGFAIMADNASKVEPCDYYANLYEASKALLFYADMLAARYGA